MSNNRIKVEFFEGGLDEILDMATSKRRLVTPVLQTIPAAYVLADTFLDKPVDCLKVWLMPYHLLKALEPQQHSFMLAAEISPMEGQHLGIGTDNLQSGFEVESAIDSLSKPERMVYRLMIQATGIPRSSLELITNTTSILDKRDGALGLYLLHDCATPYNEATRKFAAPSDERERARQAVTEFVNALEITINSINYSTRTPQEGKYLLLGGAGAKPVWLHADLRR